MSYWDRVPGWAEVGAITSAVILWIVASALIGTWVDRETDPNGIPASPSACFFMGFLIQFCIFVIICFARLIIAIWR